MTPSPTTTRFGVDPVAFRTLYGALRTLGKRRSSALLGDWGRQQGTPMWPLYLSTAVLGILAAAPLLILPAGPASLAFATVVLFVANLLVVADFATVVLAPEDDDVIFPLPVASRTYLAARLAVAARHVTILALCLGASGVLVTTIRWGSPLAALGLLLTTVASGWFALILGFAVFRLALTCFGGPRLRGFLAYAPPILGMGLAFLPQLLPGTQLPGWVLDADRLPGIWAFPPYWFAGFHHVMLEPSWHTLARSAVGVLVVPACAWGLVAALGGGTIERLQALIGSDPSPGHRAVRAPGPGALARAVFGVRSDEARAGWMFARAAMRTRAFRARAIAGELMPVMWLLSTAMTHSASGRGSSLDALLVFVTASTGTGAITLLPFGDPPDGAWFYEATPFRRYGRFYSGVVRAAVATWALPAWLAIAGLSIALVPTFERAASVVYALGAALTITALTATLDRRRPPFAERLRAGSSSGRMRVALTSLGLAAFASISFGLARAFAPAMLPVLVIGSVAAAIFAFVHLARTLDTLPPPALVATRTSG